MRNNEGQTGLPYVFRTLQFKSLRPVLFYFMINLEAWNIGITNNDEYKAYKGEKE